MKAILSLLILVAVVFSQGAPAALSAQAAEWKIVKVLTGATSDSVKAGDSLIIIPTRGFPSGYEYILMRGALTGTIADSTAYQLALDCYDPTGTVITQRVIFDTIGTGAASAGAAGEQIVLPIGKTVVGGLFRVRLKVGALNSTTALRFMPYMSLWSRKLSK
jgi:hypothetical protein